MGSSSENSGGGGFAIKGIIGGMGSPIKVGVLPTSVVGVLTGEVGSLLQIGLPPAKVVGKEMINTGGLGVSKKAGECSNEGGLAVKESSVDMGSPLWSRAMPMSVVVSTGGSAGDLRESEAADCALRMLHGAD